MEEWRKSPLCYAHVEVSNLGRVRTLDRITTNSKNGSIRLQRGTILSPWISRNGYYCVAIKVGDNRTKFLVHRLVASVFVDGFDETITVNHKDGNKLNNLPSNLEWVTLEENTKHQWRTGLVNIRGEKHPSHILSNKDVKIIRARKSSGERVTEIYKDYSHVSISLIYKICQGINRTCDKSS